MKESQKLSGRKSQTNEVPFSIEKNFSIQKKMFWTPRPKKEFLVVGDDVLPPDIQFVPTNFEASRPMVTLEDEKISPVSEELMSILEETNNTQVNGRGKARGRKKKIQKNKKK